MSTVSGTNPMLVLEASDFIPLALCRSQPLTTAKWLARPYVPTGHPFKAWARSPVFASVCRPGFGPK